MRSGNSSDEEPGQDVSLYLHEACYYLRKKGLSFQQVSKALEILEEEAERMYHVYESKIAEGVVEEDDLDRSLWEDVYNDSLGNEKITFVRDDGFYHCRRADLEKMESQALMAVFESSKKFLDFDIYKPYLDSKAPVGYDPMALQRQVKRTVELIEEILGRRWEATSKKE